MHALIGKRTSPDAYSLLLHTATLVAGNWTLHHARLVPSIHACAGAGSRAVALHGDTPGGERALAARVKRQGRSANVRLGDEAAGVYRPPWPGTPRDLSEKERPACAPNPEYMWLQRDTACCASDAPYPSWLHVSVDPALDRSFLHVSAGAGRAVSQASQARRRGRSSARRARTRATPPPRTPSTAATSAGLGRRA
jgi:hypothetical protein